MAKVALGGGGALPSQGSNPGPAVKVLSANQLLDPWGIL